MNCNLGQTSIQWIISPYDIYSRIGCQEKITLARELLHIQMNVELTKKSFSYESGKLGFETHFGLYVECSISCSGSSRRFILFNDIHAWKGESDCACRVD